MERKITASEMLELSRLYWPTKYEEANELSYYIYRIKELKTIEHQSLISQFSLSITEFDVLTTLRNTPKPHTLTPTDLRKATLLTSGGLTKLLYELERKQFISRSLGENDKRSKLVHLTENGQDAIENAMQAVLENDDKQMSDIMSKEEFQQLNSLLKKLNNHLEESMFES